MDVFRVRVGSRRLFFKVIRWRGAHFITDRFPQGNVYRLWFGWFFVKVMREASDARW